MSKFGFSGPVNAGSIGDGAAAKPPCELAWTLILRANDERAARAVLARAGKAMGLGLENVALGHYWKEDGAFRATATTAPACASPEEAAFALLSLAGALAPQWTVSAPIELDGQVIVEASAKDGFRVPGITFVAATLTARRGPG